jgi:hypothetical protein
LAICTDPFQIPEGASTVVCTEALAIVEVDPPPLENDDEDVADDMVVLFETLVESIGGGGRILNCGTLPPILNPRILSAAAFNCGRGQV